MEIYDEAQGPFTSVQKVAIDSAWMRFRGRIFVGGITMGKSYLHEYMVQQMKKETNQSDSLDATLYAIAKIQEEN